MRIGHQIGQFIDIAGHLPQTLQLTLGQALVAHLQLQGGNDGTEVGIAAALAKPVESPLNMDDAMFHRHQRIGHRTLAVVMRMNAEGGLNRLFHLGQNRGQFMGQGAAIGIAQHDAVDLRLLSGLEGIDSVFGVGLIPIEKVLSIVEDLGNMLFEIGQGIVDQFQVGFTTDAQRLADMKIPTLAEDGHSVRFGLDQGTQVVVLFRRGLGPTGGTEGCNLGLFQGDLLDLLEKGDVLGIGSRPAAFDIMDTQLVEFLGNTDFVRHQKRNLFRLGPVPQGRIVQMDQTHGLYPSPAANSVDSTIQTQPLGYPDRRLHAKRARPVQCTWNR